MTEYTLNLNQFFQIADQRWFNNSKGKILNIKTTVYYYIKFSWKKGDMCKSAITLKVYDMFKKFQPWNKIVNCSHKK